MADGYIYVGSFDDKVYCLNADTGAWIWDYTTGDDVYSSPAVDNGKVYIGSLDNKVYCLGSRLEARVLQLESSLTNALERIDSLERNSLALAVRGSDNGIYWCKYDGASWTGWTKLPGSTPDSPAISVLGNDLHLVVMGSDDGLYHGYVDLDTEVFSGWTKLSGSTPNAPVLIPVP